MNKDDPEISMYRLSLLSVAAIFAVNTACTEYSIEGNEDEVITPPDGYPAAVCSVSPSPVTPPFESATWSGEGSYDPDGLAITFAWELISAPAGSAVSMPTGAPTDPTREGFTPDMAGDYVARLTVTNEHGNASTCEATLAATPAQDMWVEMYWQYSGDDMDLHLLAPGGVVETDSDCYYANCVDWGYGGLDWGTLGNGGDDPALDLDDIPGTGPENINISSPQNGIYTVLVNDYPGSVYAGGNNVTINIYLGGELAWSDTRTITTEDSYNYFARIDWTTKVVTGM